MNTPRIPRGLLLAACLAPSALFAQNPFTTLPSGPEVRVGSTSVTPVRTAQQTYDLGFNMPWDSVQNLSTSGTGELWDGSALRLPFYNFLKERGAFTGAIYRYPGGTNSNYFNWGLSIGTPVSSRTPMRYAAGSNATLRPQFGLDEFLRFVEQAKGKAMLTVNMLTVVTSNNDVATYQDIGANSTLWAQAKNQAIGLLEYCNAPYVAGLPASPTNTNYDWNGDGIYQATLRKNNGHELPYNVLLWEMGNELDTVGYYYFPQIVPPNNTTLDESGRTRYATRAKELMEAMQAAEKMLLGVPAATYIVHAVTNPDDPLRPGLRWLNTDGTRVWTNWHKEVLTTTPGVADAMAFHPYYDGNVVPSQNALLNVIWNDTTARLGSAAIPIHLTEHAQWPADIDVQATWPATTGLSGAISNADFILGNAHKTQMRSALNHNLGAIGPWALFSEIGGDGRYANTSVFNPRPLSYGLTLMHRAFTPQAEIMSTALATPSDNSNYATGNSAWNGYDARGIVFRHGTTYGAAVASRAPTKDYNLLLTFPGWTAGSWVVRQEGIGGTAAGDTSYDAPIWTRYFPVQVASSQGYVKLLKRSVSVSTAIAPNYTVNGDFSGALSSSWFTGWDTGVTGTATQQTADTTTPAYGNCNIRLKKNNTAAGGYMLVQPYKNGTTIINNDLGPTGIIATNMNNRFVLRALVRPSGLANGVKLKVQFYNSAGAGVGNAFSTASSTNSGKWEPLALEFIPSQILTAGATFSRADLVLYNSSSNAGHADFSSITLEHTPNLLLNPLFATDSDNNGTPDGWQHRVETYNNSAVGSIQRLTENGYFYERLTKSGGQPQHEVAIAQENSATLAGGTLDKRRGEKWRLRAKIRYNNMPANGVKLRLQFFNQGTGFVASSPAFSLPTSAGSNSAWQDITVNVDTSIPAALRDIHPRDVIGTGTFQKAEAVLINSSSSPSATCYVDIRSMSLEVLD